MVPRLGRKRCLWENVYFSGTFALWIFSLGPFAINDCNEEFVSLEEETALLLLVLVLASLFRLRLRFGTLTPVSTTAQTNRRLVAQTCFVIQLI